MTELKKLSQTIDRQRRPVGNNMQKQLPTKLYLDTKVEGWAVCFCLSPLGANFKKQ